MRKKIATLFTLCLIGGGMFYAVVVLTAAPARAASCDCAAIARDASALCYVNGHAESNDFVPNGDGGSVFFCNSTSWAIRCEDGYFLNGGC